MSESTLVGKTLGRYRILDRIGAGGMGEVYRAHDEVLRRDVAVKVLPASTSADPDRLRRFKQEAQSTGALNHPNILAIYDFGEYEGSPYAVSELLEGQTLRDRMVGDALPVRKVVEYGVEIARGLSAAHEKGIVHRDLKPENLFITNDGRVKILDFGIAKLLRPEGPEGGEGETSAPTQTEVGVVLGTTGYMAPEQVRGEAVDQRADLFALGSVLYEMLAGRRAFAGATPADTMSAILTQDPPPLESLREEVSSDLDRTIRRCLEKSPRERFQTAVDLANDLERLAESGSHTASGIPFRWLVPARLRGGLRRHAVWGVVLGVTVCAAIAGLAIAWTMGWRPAITARKPVVAVLPTRNLSEDPTESAYLSEAFGEELVTRLGRAPNVRLLPWLTTQRFTDPKQRLDAVGRELHADKLVVGSFRSDGERVRVTVALVDARTGVQSWSEAYEEDIEDLFTLQQGVATGIASHLGGTLTKVEKEKVGEAASRSPEAYEYYLRGANFMNSGDPQSSAMAGPFFEKALALDADLALAWVGVGAVSLDLYFRGQSGDADLDAAEKAFRRALALNPQLYSASRGLVRIYYEQGRYEDALRIGQGVSVRERDVEALLARGWAYLLGGLPDKAVPLFDRALELDPGSQATAWARPMAEAWAGELPLTVAHARSYLKKYGEDAEMYLWLGVGLYGGGEKLQARLAMTRSLELFGEKQSNIYSVLYTMNLYRDLGEAGRADSLGQQWLEILDARLQANPDNMRSQIYRAGLASILGGVGEGQRLDSLALDFRDRTVRAVGFGELFNAFGTGLRLRKALLAVQGSDLALDYAMLKSGVIRLSFGAQYSFVEALPEFKSYLAAVQRRHAELAARY